MSLFSVQLDNNLQIRAKEVFGEEFYTRENGQWIPLKPGGGGGGGDLPYYLKPNAVTLEGVDQFASLEPQGMTFRSGLDQEQWGANEIMESRFKMNRIDNDVADVDLKANILKDRVDHVINVTIPSIDDDINNINNVVLPAHEDSINQVDQKVTNITDVAIPQLASDILQVNTQVTTNTNDITVLKAKQLKDPIVFTGSNKELRLSSSTGITYTHFSVSPQAAVNISYDTITCGHSSSKTYMSPGAFSVNSGGVHRILTGNSIKMVNDLENISAATNVPNSKMVVFNPTTRVFNHTNIPSGGGTGPDTGFFKVETPEETNVEYVAQVEVITADGPWKTVARPGRAKASGMYRFDACRELTLDFEAAPLVVENAMTMGLDYGLFMEGLETTDSVTCFYAPKSGADSNQEFTASVEMLAFHTFTQPFLRFHASKYGKTGVTYNGKLHLIINKASTNKKPTYIERATG